MTLQYYKKATHALRYWLLRRLPACKQMAAVMSQSLERRLTLRERVLLKFHLWVCIWCVWYLEHLRFMGESLRVRSAQTSDRESSPTAVTLSADARARLKRALTHRGP